MEVRKSRSRGVTVSESQQVRITIVRRSGGKGRLRVSADFDPNEVEDVRISVEDESVKSDVERGIGTSGVGN